jgi:group I intron endonuclease
LRLQGSQARLACDAPQAKPRVASAAITGEKNPMFGVKLFGSLNPFFGKKHTEETKQILSKINSGENHPFFGKTHTEETKLKQSMARGITIYLYSLNFELLETFISARKAGLYLGSSKGTILKYAESGLVFKKKYILSFNQLNI